MDLNSYVTAFWVGGLICALVQILLEKTKLMPGRVMVILVCLGAVVSFFGWYEPFMEFAGAGATAPLTGFGNVLADGVREAVELHGFVGIFTGGIAAASAGITTAIVFGLITALIFRSKEK